MTREILLLFLRKELSDLRSNRQVWPAYVLLPIVVVALPLIILVALPALTDAARAGLRVSARFTDVPGAMQFTGLLVMPLCLVLVALTGRPAMLSPVAGLLGTVFLTGLALWLFSRNLRRFRREKILTKWK